MGTEMAIITTTYTDKRNLHRRLVTGELYDIAQKIQDECQRLKNEFGGIQLQNIQPTETETNKGILNITKIIDMNNTHVATVTTTDRQD